MGKKLYFIFIAIMLVACSDDTDADSEQVELNTDTEQTENTIDPTDTAFHSIEQKQLTLDYGFFPDMKAYRVSDKAIFTNQNIDNFDSETVFEVAGLYLNSPASVEQDEVARFEASVFAINEGAIYYDLPQGSQEVRGLAAEKYFYQNNAHRFDSELEMFNEVSLMAFDPIKNHVVHGQFHDGDFELYDGTSSIGKQTDVEEALFLQASDGYALFNFKDNTETVQNHLYHYEESEHRLLESRDKNLILGKIDGAAPVFSVNPDQGKMHWYDVLTGEFHLFYETAKTADSFEVEFNEAGEWFVKYYVYDTNEFIIETPRLLIDGLNNVRDVHWVGKDHIIFSEEEALVLVNVANGDFEVLVQGETNGGLAVGANHIVYSSVFGPPYIIQIVDESNVDHYESLTMHESGATTDSEEIEESAGSMDEDKQEEERAPKEKEVDIETALSNAVGRYLNSLIKAINENDFAYVEPTLTHDSALYHDQIALVNRMDDLGITQALVGYDVIDYDLHVTSNQHIVTVVETIDIIQADGSNEVRDFTWSYTVDENNNRFTLSKIESPE
ncbi:TcaA NTF2-like domain-containing protein [Evansella cellulosilytica]|uniref:TcaA protein NTF2-like domain-containing protein n=1 Tax=Evansella cellulosilytica (strain ATCC 21833 / DSM 2522 / FERM P-1141 / JCM 9156 / N-4) TaxID=649639 RepID=E6TTX6_EVAC2|nr:hypothetical protein [Evansella cellulosilytica]ADU32007.1 hypothetical protein Bcell_3767 [Evansella cellulosilytica DSM 2522]